MMRAAVIPTHDRPALFAASLQAIQPQVDHVFVIAHRCDYPHAFASEHLTVLDYDAQLPNISAMWNLGIDAARKRAPAVAIAVLNDDAIAPPDWFAKLHTAIVAHGCAAGSQPRLSGASIAGWAFIIAHPQIRADEQFQWWYGDDDIQQQARRLGGFAIMRSINVPNRLWNSTTEGALAQIARADLERFRAKWEYI